MLVADHLLGDTKFQNFAIRLAVMLSTIQKIFALKLFMARSSICLQYLLHSPKTKFLRHSISMKKLSATAIIGQVLSCPLAWLIKNWTHLSTAALRQPNYLFLRSRVAWVRGLVVTTDGHWVHAHQAGLAIHVPYFGP